jgi:uncharacterized protein (TIGR02145 family)
MKVIFKLTLVLFLISLFVIVSCDKKEKKAMPIVPETGTLTDIEGRVYNTVKIGDQWWMAEDLTVKQYRNGDPIIRLQDNSLWASDTIGAYSLNSYQYYNWFAIKNPKMIAPEGWHIPTDEEWKKLEMNLGMNAIEAGGLAWRGNEEGNKLKANKNNVWSSSAGQFGTNESGFDALPNNCRLFDGVYGFPNGTFQGFWWTSTDLSKGEAWFRNLDYKKSSIFRSHTLKNYGFSVRCVKD